MKRAFTAISAAAFLAAWSSAALGQSAVGNTAVGSCPDATSDEAAAMGFRQVPIEMPQFVQRGALSAEGFEARIAAHKTQDFSIIEQQFKQFMQVEPQLQNKVAPLPDAKLFQYPDEFGTPPQKSPLYAFCFSYTPNDWSFMPGAEVSGLGLNAAVAGLAPLTIPAQTYAVFEYDGPRRDTANFRYTLTSAFWPVSAVRRVESPNFEVYPNGDDGVSENVSLQLWVAVDASTIPSGFQALNYSAVPQ